MTDTADHDDSGDPSRDEGPEAMRQAMASYIRAVHEGYLAALSGRATTDEVASLPLAGEPFTVAAVGAGQLHVIATRDLTIDLDPREIIIEDELGPLRWNVRFLDPVVLPALGLVDDSGPSGGEVIVETLELHELLYRLTSSIEGGLSPHQATHAGAGLADAHLRAAKRADDA